MAMRQYTLISAIVVSILLSTAAVASGGEEAQRSGWLQLDLVETTIAGITIYYEKTLDPNLSFLERPIRAFLEARAGGSDLLDRKEEIVADINHILGTDDASSAEQGQMLARLAGVFVEIEPTFYLVRTSTIEEFVRAGGELPDCTYNRIEDEVRYNPRFPLPPQERLSNEFELCVPVPPDAPFEEYVSSAIGAFGELVAGPADVAIREVAEATLLHRARPTDPYWRWFSAGFANAITYRLLEKYQGAEAALEFALAFDPVMTRGMEKEANVAYWMMVEFDPFGMKEIPIESQKRFVRARYAYSMSEAQRLIDEHGIECVREILDEIAARDSRKSGDLLEVIEEVTGEDMAARLARYQDFETKEEGIAQYAAEGNAIASGDWEALLAVFLRVNELRGDVFSANYLMGLGNVALCLSRMGYEAAGDDVMQNAIRLYSKSPIEHGREAALEMFLNYAIQSGHPSKALLEADELLEADPNTIAALTIKMMVATERRNFDDAQSLAERVLQRAGEKSINRRLANQVLAIDPNMLGQTP